MSDAPDFALLRQVEAILFAAADPLAEAAIAAMLPDGADLPAILAQLQQDYAPRGVNLMRVANGWAFRTAPDLAGALVQHVTEARKLSRAAVETLAIIAYHQPVTRAEIEEMRGVALSKGTLDVLMEAEWVMPKGRKRTPGRPMTYGTSDRFLDHFGLAELSALPGLDELKAAGLMDRTPRPDLFQMAEQDGEDESELPLDWAENPEPTEY